MASGHKSDPDFTLDGLGPVWQRKEFGSRDNSDPEFGDCHAKVPGLKSMDITLALRKKDCTNMVVNWFPG